MGDGDVVQIEFKAMKELLDYLSEIRKSKFDCVWLCSGEGNNGFNEILITENIMTIELAIEGFIFTLFKDFEQEELNHQIHLHEYETYEDAYAVALDMREPNPKCYNKNV